MAKGIKQKRHFGIEITFSVELPFSFHHHFHFASHFLQRTKKNYLCFDDRK